MPVLASIREMFTAATWPPDDLREVWTEIERFAAFRTSDTGVLRMEESIRWQDDYMVSPVPRMVSRAKANLLYGEPAEYKAAVESDQDRLDYVIQENDLDTEAHRGAMISSSEGEVWGRILLQPALLDCPIIDLVSRRRVIPIFSGRFVVGATFVCEWPIDATTVMRLFEHYEAGAIRSELYEGTRINLGQERPLDSFEQTKGTPPVVLTGIEEPLCAFIPNSIDDDVERGFSDYRGLEERFLGINRASTIGDSNTRLAGKKRALLDAEYTGPGGTVRDNDLYIRSAQNTDLGDTKPLQMLEYSYDATQITTWLDHLIDSTLSFGGAAPQLVGRNLDGAALSGTALRLKMIHSLMESSGAGRYQDRGYRRLLRFAQILDSRRTTDLGFGRPWAKPDDQPTVIREDGLPRDDLEAATYLSTLVTAESISLDERVAYLHPDWEQDDIDAEVAKIEAEAKAAQPAPLIAPAGTPPAPEMNGEEPVRAGK